MDLIRLGGIIRAVRLRARLRQADVAAHAGVSQATVSRLERGHAGSLPLETIDRIARTLEIRLDIVPRWRGGQLDRMMGAGHAQLAGVVIGRMARQPGWVAAPEVSFSRWGERGVVDVLAWHRESRTVLVIELKTQLVDVSELLGTLDRKRRLALWIAAERGWTAATASAWVLIADTMTNRRRVDAHRSLLRAALPHGWDDAAAMARITRRPGRRALVRLYQSPTDW